LSVERLLSLPALAGERFRSWMFDVPAYAKAPARQAALDVSARCWPF